MTEVAEGDIEELLEEFPNLKTVAPLVAFASDLRWFRGVGEDPDISIVDKARTYAEALGFPYVEPAFLGDWYEAADAAENTEFNSPAWEAEEQLRAALTTDVLSVIDEPTFEMVMSYIAQSVVPHIEEAAKEAAEFLRIDDESFVLAVSGAAAQALHQAALVGLAGEEEDHPLALRFQLFEKGRWPIGIIGNSFLIF